MLAIDTFIEVRYYETDQMGVVHHSNYIRYFETARTSSMNKAGIPYTDMEAQGIVMPIVAAHCEYKRPALFGDILRITTILEVLPTVKIRYKYEVRNQNDVLLAVGYTDLAFARKDTLRPMRAPQYLLDKLAPYFEDGGA